jgi:hypothetical protein
MAEAAIRSSGQRRRGTTLLRACFAAAALWTHLALGQIPDQGRFDYILYDNGDRPVGTYYFTIEKEGGVWRISSDMNVDTRLLLFAIRLRDRNSFTHDGKSFLSFHVSYFKDVPLQRTVQLEVSGVRNLDDWTVRTTRDGAIGARRFAPDSFEDVRNLISRLVRPEAVLQPGQVRKSRSLDPLSLEIDDVETRGVAIGSVEFQGRRRELFVMETKSSDGDVRVQKFSNGLIYRSQTNDGYALLKSAQCPSF